MLQIILFFVIRNKSHKSDTSSHQNTKETLVKYMFVAVGRSAIWEASHKCDSWLTSSVNLLKKEQDAKEFKRANLIF